MARKLPQSCADSKELEKMCESASVQYRSVIQPVNTRCNSNYMMLPSICKIREGLEMTVQSVQAQGNSGSLPKGHFSEHIPASNEFHLMVKLVEFLRELKNTSLAWEADKTPTIH